MKELSNGLSTFSKLENIESELMAVTQAGIMSLVESHKAAFWDQFCFRHSLVRAKGEAFVLLLLFVCFFCQRFLDNPLANSRQILHTGVLWFRIWGLAAPGGRKKGEMKFSLLWESMGNFCILAVFERYLSNACTDPHQILFVYGHCLPTCPLPLWDPSDTGRRGEGELKTQKIGGGLIRAADSYHFYFSQRCQM